MKRIVLLILLILSIFNLINAQQLEWAPKGAKWQYDWTKYTTSRYIYYYDQHIESLGDTIMYGQLVKKIRESYYRYDYVNDTIKLAQTKDHYYRQDTTRIYECFIVDTSIIDTTFDCHILYNLSLGKGDSILTYTKPEEWNKFFPFCYKIAEIGDTTINDITLKTQSLGPFLHDIEQCFIEPGKEIQFKFGNKIIEQIGNIFTFRPFEEGMAHSISSELRCYWDPIIGQVQFKDSCEMHWVSRSEEIQLKKESIKWYIDNETLFLTLPEISSKDYRICNHLGQVLMTGQILQYNEKFDIDVAQLPKGVYFIQIDHTNIKFIK